MMIICTTKKSVTWRSQNNVQGYPPLVQNPMEPTCLHNLFPSTLHNAVKTKMPSTLSILLIRF